MTLSEILRGSQGAANRTPPLEQMKDNLMANAVPLMVGVVGIPIAAKVITKLVRKPVLLPANRMLKSVGLDVKV